MISVENHWIWFVNTTIVPSAQHGAELVSPLDPKALHALLKDLIKGVNIFKNQNKKIVAKRMV